MTALPLFFVNLYRYKAPVKLLTVLEPFEYLCNPRTTFGFVVAAKAHDGAINVVFIEDHAAVKPRLIAKLKSPAGYPADEICAVVVVLRKMNFKIKRHQPIFPNVF